MTKTFMRPSVLCTTMLETPSCCFTFCKMAVEVFALFGKVREVPFNFEK